nr:ester cyclase [Candidatus Poribacteria bacterium]
MKGFNSKFKNFPDYINGITYEIWEEENGVEKLHEYYASDVVMRTPSSITIGNEAVIAATEATLLEFPDRKLIGEDVIWSGSPEEGMLSSHRIISTATHLGDGQFGKATGQKLTYRVIADCHAINNQINDEWLTRDRGSMVRQMEWTPENFARQEIDR